MTTGDGSRPVLTLEQGGGAPVVAAAAAVASLRELGRIWYPEDVLELYRRRDGNLGRSRAWVLAHFAPEARHREGRLVYWFERDVRLWFERTREASR